MLDVVHTCWTRAVHNENVVDGKESGTDGLLGRHNRYCGFLSFTNGVKIRATHTLAVLLEVQLVREWDG